GEAGQWIPAVELEEVRQMHRALARWVLALELLPLTHGNRGIDDRLGDVRAEWVARKPATWPHHVDRVRRVAPRVDRPPHIVDAVHVHVVVDHDAVLQPAVGLERGGRDGSGLTSRALLDRDGAAENRGHQAHPAYTSTRRTGRS